MPEYFITATLVLETALHIGSGKGGNPTDAPVRRAGDGRLLIPGPAIAGSLRTLATRLAPRLKMKTCQALRHPKKRNPRKPCGCPVCQLFGDVHPVEKPSDKGDWTEARASHLWVYDAFADAQTPTFVRDGVGIDRSTGHAAENVKFDYEIVPRGTRFALNMRLAYNVDADDLAASTEEQICQLLAAALAEWEAGRGQLGGNVSRGLGRFSLEGLAYKQPKLDTPDALEKYLKAANRADASQPVPGWSGDLLKAARNNREERKKDGRSQSIAAAFLNIQLDFSFDDLFLQNDPLVALISGFDHAPLIENLRDDGLGNPILAGSSIRGVLRSQAGKIIRTLYTNYCLDHEDDAADAFMSNCPACNVLEGKKTEALANCPSRLKEDEHRKHHEWQEEDFCLLCRLFGNQERGSRLWVQDGRWQKGDAVNWQAQDFLAIDRFTGGGLDGAKFDAAPLYQARFRTTITLHDPEEWELGLLALLLRDLAQGHITIGFGAAKGYGRCQASNITWAVGYLTDADRQFFPNSITGNAKVSGIYNLSQNQADDWLPDGWLDKAQGWVKRFNETINGFNRSAELEGLQVDTYFNGRIDALYGRARTEVRAS